MDLRIVYVLEDYAVMYCNGTLVLEGDPSDWTLELILKQLSPNSKIFNYEISMDEYQKLNLKMPDSFKEVKTKLGNEHEFTDDDLKAFSKKQNLVKTLNSAKEWVEV